MKTAVESGPASKGRSFYGTLSATRRYFPQTDRNFEVFCCRFQDTGGLESRIEHTGPPDHFKEPSFRRSDLEEFGFLEGVPLRTIF